MNAAYDIHLSAIRISRSTIDELETIGFRRDEFANNTRCVASEYHATYHGDVPLPNDELWAQTCNILTSDPLFEGGLEEELIPPGNTVIFNGDGGAMPTPLPAFAMEAVKTGEHKACDLHIGIVLQESSSAAMTILEGLNAPSFDKPIPEGTRRVFTVTCETLDDGRRLFASISDYLAHVHGLKAKMKLEATTRFLRLPDNAPTLPICRHAAVCAWLESADSRLRD